MDWADFKVLNPDGGSFFVYLFVVLLGFSRAMFACFVERCTLQAFMDSLLPRFITWAESRRRRFTIICAMS